LLHFRALPSSILA